MLVDTHAHLCDAQFDPDRAQALERAAEAGIGVVVEIADNEKEWGPARALAEQHPGRVYWTAGCHPHYADQGDDGLPERLLALLDHPQLVAVGEIGLDFFRNPIPPEVQTQVFDRLLRLAVERDKPVVIHCREAKGSTQAEEIMGPLFNKYYSSIKGKDQGVLHCFQGSLAFAQAAIELGFFIGVDGPLTYPNAGPLRAVIQALPLERLVLETDSPYLPPQNKRGQRNEPAAVAQVAEELARLKVISLEEVRQATTRNAEKLYRLSFRP